MLTESLAALDAANTAKSEFLDAVELEYTVAGSKVTVEAKTAKDGDVKAYYTATTAELAKAGQTGLSGFADKSASLQDAAIAEKKASLEKTVANAKKDTASNMTSLLEDVTAKEKAVVAKNKELIEATTAANAEAAKLGVLDAKIKVGTTAVADDNQPTTAKPLTATVNTDLAIATIATVNKDGVLELVSYDAATMKSFTAAQLTAVQAKAADYIAAFNANVAAGKAVDAAVTALETAAEAVVLADTKAYSIADQGALIATTNVKGNANFKVEANFAAPDVKVFETKAKEEAAAKITAPVAEVTTEAVKAVAEVQTLTVADIVAAGITAGDIIVKINGTDYTVTLAGTEADQDAVATKIAGAINTALASTSDADIASVVANGAVVTITYKNTAGDKDNAVIFAGTTGVAVTVDEDETGVIAASEVQTIKFADAIKGGTIKVGTVDVVIAKGETGTEVATKVAAAYATASGFTSVTPSTDTVTFIFNSTDNEPEIVVTDANNVFAPTKEGAIANSVAANLTDVTKLQNAIEALETFKQLIVDFEASRDLNTELTALNKAVKDATEAITNPVEPEDADVTPGLGLDLITIVDDISTPTATPKVIADSKNNVFLLDLTDDSEVQIANFGTDGLDQLFVGSGYNFVKLGSKEKITDNLGDVSALEIFYKQEGSDVKLYIENETFAGNGSTAADMITITLTGISTDDISFNGGLIQAGEIA